MPIWQVQIQGITILGQPMQKICYNEKLKNILKNLPNLLGISDDTLVVDYDSDGKDHDEML